MLAALLLLSHGAAALNVAVTGAAGYLGAEIACMAAAQGHSVRAVIKEGQAVEHLKGCEVVKVEDLCDLAVARDVAEGMDAVLHAASVFRKCEDMEVDLVQPNIALAETMVCACAAHGARLVLTSSMAAVRGTGQAPLRGEFYTTEDWNVVSQRDGPGFEPYQFSKAESERRAWELSRRLGGEMVSLCPSMIFGPPRVSFFAFFARARASSSLRTQRISLGCGEPSTPKSCNPLHPPTPACVS